MGKVGYIKLVGLLYSQGWHIKRQSQSEFWNTHAVSNLILSQSSLFYIFYNIKILLQAMPCDREIITSHVILQCHFSSIVDQTTYPNLLALSTLLTVPNMLREPRAQKERFHRDCHLRKS